MLRHFALNVAAAVAVWAWGFATGQQIARIFPALDRERGSWRA